MGINGRHGRGPAIKLALSILLHLDGYLRRFLLESESGKAARMMDLELISRDEYFLTPTQGARPIPGRTHYSKPSDVV
jgi:hypothetical protein